MQYTMTDLLDSFLEKESLDCEEYNVLSFFDGMSCGQIALEKAGIKVLNYFACEIDKYAISVAKKNFPNTIHLGDVVNVKATDLPKIDLFIGGSPCQGFSVAGKKLNFDDPRSKLFFEFVRVLEEIKKINPNVKFLLENVSMKKEFRDIISERLGVKPIEINSALVSAQNRKRLYWTNIKGVCLPKDKGILLKDIVHENCLTDRDKSRSIIASIGRTTTREYFKKNQGQMVAQFNELSEKEIAYMLKSNEKWKQSENGRLSGYLQYPEQKANTITANIYKGVPYNVYYQSLAEYIVPFDKTLQILDKEVARGKVGYFRKDSQANRVYYIHDKAVTLCGDAGGGAAKMGQYLFGEINREVHQISEGKESNGVQPYMQNRVYNENGLSPSLTQECGRLNVAISKNGQRFNDGTKFYTLTAFDKHGILIEGYIRKLTPIECERLQTLPDNYTEGVSNSQRYKMLGNGWTVDVISHIFSFLK
ncbi:MAG TPA: DNA (cytosine-5-)-methyltransferase [Flavobacterium sp.]